jgi:hypothetical protein
MRPIVLGNLAVVAMEEGDRMRAAALDREALALQRTLRNQAVLANSLEAGADYAAVGGQPDVAARLLGAAEAVRLRAGIAIDSFNVDEHQAFVARVREQLDEPAFNAAWAQGESFSLDEAIAEADAVLAVAARGDTGGER